MPFRTASVLVVLAAAGCGADSSPAPISSAAQAEPEILFMVKNEVLGIRLDGTGRRSFGVAGDDRRRAGYPRLLPDGRISVLADVVGHVYPFVSGRDRRYARVGEESLWVGDGGCGVTIGGTPMLVYFSTQVYTDGNVASIALRATTDGQNVEAFAGLRNAGLFGPSPDGPDHLLAVRAPIVGDDEIWRIDASRGQDAFEEHQVVATVKFPKVARSPSRLPDGRVVYVQFDMRDRNGYGELWVVERDGSQHGTGLMGIDDAQVVGDKVVLEAGGANRITELIATDLVHPPYNLTRTPYVAEHLGWGAYDLRR